MANVNTARMRVVLVDDLTAPMRQMKSAVDSFNRAIMGVGGNGKSGFSSANSDIANINKNLELMSADLKGVYGNVVKLTGAWKTLGTAYNMFQSTFGGFFDYAKDFQTNAVGISGILSSMTTVGGKQLEWNQAMLISRDIMKDLRIEALQTAATSKDLIETFRAVLGPGMSQGMNIKQIMEYTKVGVNAVKSLGLPQNQLVQELRSILQGNIRPASSTLATALNISNEDIKNAKNKVNGVYDLLMERMKGFKFATSETANTMAGQFEILKEAVLTIGQEASDKVFATYSNALNRINSLLLVNDGGKNIINPKMVDMFSKISDAVDNIVTGIVNIGENVYGLFDRMATWVITLGALPKVIELISTGAVKLREKADGIRNVLDVSKKLEQERINAVYQNIEASEKEIASKQRLEKIQSQIKNIINSFSNNNTNIKFPLEDRIKSLGLSTEESSKLILKYLKAVQNGELELVSAIEKAISSQEKQAKAQSILSSAFSKCANILSKVVSVLGQFSGMLSTVGFALMTFGDTQDEATQKFANYLIVGDMAISGLTQLRTTIISLREWWIALDLAAKSAYITMAGLAGVAVVAGAVAYERYNHYKEYGLSGFGHKNDESSGYGYKDENGNWIDDVQYVTPREEEEYKNGALGASKSRRRAEVKDRKSNDAYVAEQEAKKLREQLKINPYGSGSGSGTDSKGKKGKTIEEITTDYQSLISSIKSTTSSLNENGDAYQKTMDKADKQISDWNKKLATLKKSGFLSDDDLTTAKNMISDYYNEMVKKANEARDKQNLALNEAMLSEAKLTMELGWGNQQDEYDYTNKLLESRKAMLEIMLAEYRDNAQKRIEIEKQLAETLNQIRQNNMYNMKTAWRSALEEMAMQQINYGEYIKNTFSSIENAGVSLLNSTESFGERIKNFFSDIASSLMQEMSKLIMKALITNVLLKALGIGVSGMKYSGNISDYVASTSNTNYSYNGNLGSYVRSNGFAKGGYASGWSIVGEQGPELVNFSNPARVYTAKQTANALSNAGGGNVNIKIDLKNESGQKLEAETTGSNFDGESYIVGVVLKAINTNKYGMRTTMKGLANA